MATWLPEGRWATADDLGSRPGEDAVRPGRKQVDAARWRRVRLARLGARLSGWPRWALAAVLLVAAVLVALRPGGARTAPAPPAPARDVAVATRDLAAGTVLSATDLRTVAMPVAMVPAGAVTRPAAAIGRTAAGPVRRGETITDARIIGPGLTAGLDPGGSAAVPVRLAEPEAAAIVRAGDRIDVLGTAVDADGTAPARDAIEVAADARVLAVLGSRSEVEGVVVVVAVTPPVARRLAGAAARQRLTIAVRPP